MSNIMAVKESMTKLPVDCVVNAANEGLWAGGGVWRGFCRDGM